MSTEILEREDKYDVATDWALPDLDKLRAPGGEIAHDRVRLSSTYYDTAGHDLLAAKITLRRRTGDADVGWQLKLPEGTARIEVHSPIAGRAVPRELREIVAGLCSGQRLAPVARIDTERTRTRLLDADGATLVEVADDRVSATVLGDVPVVSAWREVEVELGTGTEQLLGRIGKRLRAKGAVPAAGPSKLARALALPSGAAQTPHHAPATVGEVVAAYLADQYTALLAGDVALRRGGDAVHPIRVATRRYRSVLREFAGLWDAERATALEAELAWYAAALGEVRDRQVLREHLSGAIGALPAEVVFGPVAAHVESHLLADQLTARTRVDRALRGRRYAALLAQLRVWRDDPPFTAAAAAPALGVKRTLDRSATRLDRRLERARRPDADDATLHRARKAAKRARYIAELAGPVAGKPARRVRKRARAVQDGLGAHQDAVVAARQLLDIGARAAGTGREDGFTVGVLYAQELARAAAARAALAD